MAQHSTSANELTFSTSTSAKRTITRFKLEPDEDTRAALAQDLGVSDIRKLRFDGEIRPLGKKDWQLSASLGATVIQPCVVTLEPVTTRIDTPVERKYLADFQEPEGQEVEMPEDETAEPMPGVINVEDVMVEALSLLIPAYPRKDGAESGEAVFAAPGVKALRDEDLRPFNALSALKDKLSNQNDGEE